MEDALQTARSSSLVALRLPERSSKFAFEEKGEFPQQWNFRCCDGRGSARMVDAKHALIMRAREFWRPEAAAGRLGAPEQHVILRSRWDGACKHLGPHRRSLEASDQSDNRDIPPYCSWLLSWPVCRTALEGEAEPPPRQPQPCSFLTNARLSTPSHQHPLPKLSPLTTSSPIKRPNKIFDKQRHAIINDELLSTLQEVLRENHQAVQPQPPLTASSGAISWSTGPTHRGRVYSVGILHVS